MKRIETIRIEDDNGFFANKNFLWDKIGSFSVMVGINGSGKTKILDYISSSEEFSNSHLIRYIDIDYKPPLEKHHTNIKEKYSFQYYWEEDGKLVAVDKKGDKKNNWSKASFKTHNVMKSLDYSILDKIIEERLDFQKSNYDDHIAELQKLKIYNETGNILELLPEDKKNDNSWDKIDRILNDFGLQIRIERENLNAGISFLRKECNARLETKDLSSGEKVAFALALWTWANSNKQRTEILLIDEFDAHLNPSIAEKFVSVIKKYFVDLGVQVFMTTHNPSTVAYANKHNADIVWIDDGHIDKEKDYSDIIALLSDGLIDVNDFESDLQFLIKNQKKCVLYTEGKSDASLIKSARKALKMGELFKDIFIFGCTGVESVPLFIKMPTDQEVQIALFDSDEGGRDTCKKVRNNEEKKIKKGKLKTLFISCVEDEEIENLIDSQISKGKTKMALANFMAKEENLTEENFKKFQPLLEKIIDASKIS